MLKDKILIDTIIIREKHSLQSRKVCDNVAPLTPLVRHHARTTNPSASVLQMLRVLDADPRFLSKLTANNRGPIQTRPTGALDVTAEHIARLDEKVLPAFMSRLIEAEANAYALKNYDLHINSEVRAADGGIDGKISWSDELDRTKYLPCQENYFQFKAGNITEASATRDVSNKNGNVEPAIFDSLNSGGSYILICGHHAPVQKRNKVCAALTAKFLQAGLKLKPDQVQFYSSEVLAQWTNDYPSAAVWVLENTQANIAGPFRSWDHWARTAQHSQALTVDPRLSDVKSKVMRCANTPKSVLKVLGASGVGKSRLVMESFGSDITEPNSDNEHMQLLYTDLHLFDAAVVKSSVLELADNGKRNVVVVDHCDPEMQQHLSGLIQRAGSQLSLIVIDDEIPETVSHDDPNKIVVPNAENKVIKGIITSRLPNLPEPDLHRLIEFSNGNARIAALIADSWDGRTPLANFTDADLVDKTILGRNAVDRDKLLTCAKLLSAFGSFSRSFIPEIVKHGRGVTVLDVEYALAHFHRRGVLQKKTGRVQILPLPIALNLAERQWIEWRAKIEINETKLQDLLFSIDSSPLVEQIAEQLALINTTNVAIEVANKIAEDRNTFRNIEFLASLPDNGLLSCLTEIDPIVYALLLWRVLSSSQNKIVAIQPNGKAQILRALQVICFDVRTFDMGCKTLLLLATAEKPEADTGATKQFLALFPVLLGETEAAGPQRLKTLSQMVADADQLELPILTNALFEGAKTSSFHRSRGGEIQGSRPVLSSWRPFGAEAIAYIESCVQLLIDIACNHPKHADTIKRRLGQSLRGFFLSGMPKTIEKIVSSLHALGDSSWSEATSSLGDIIVYDLKVDDQPNVRLIRDLLLLVEPQNTFDRVKLFVSEMPWDYPCDQPYENVDRDQVQRDVVFEVADEILAGDQTLFDDVISFLSRGPHRMAHVFGERLGSDIHRVHNSFDNICAALSLVPANEQNFEILAGLICGAKTQSDELATSLKNLVQSDTRFTASLPLIMWRFGISDEDALLASDLIASGKLPPIKVGLWQMGRGLQDVTPPALATLIDVLLKKGDDGFSIATNLLGMYIHNDPALLEFFSEQIRSFIRSLRPQSQSLPVMVAHHFEQIVRWSLEEHPDLNYRKELAAELAHLLVSKIEDMPFDMPNNLTSILLAKFPTVCWPIFGNAIIKDKAKWWRFEYLFNDAFSNKKNSPILQLPIEMLFAWCHSHSPRAPGFVAGLLPIFADESTSDLHPVLSRFIDEFGNLQEVRESIESNFYNYSWSGTRASYFEQYLTPFKTLADHTIREIRIWSQNVVLRLEDQIRIAKDEDRDFD